MESDFRENHQAAHEETSALAVSVDDFSALEERVRRTVDVVKREREARSAAEALLGDLEARATKAEGQLNDLEARAVLAEARQAEFETRATQAESRQIEYESRARQAEDREADLESRARRAEDRQADFEARATLAEAQFKSQTPVLEQLKYDLSAMRAEREQVKQRVERLLSQLDALEL